MILIVDDDPKVLAQAQVALAAVRTHGILFAETAKRAFELLDKFSNEILVAVINMNIPDINGFELVTIISRRYPKLRVIAISAYDSYDTLESATVMGAAGVLMKPISPAQWDDIVERVRKARVAAT